VAVIGVAVIAAPSLAAVIAWPSLAWPSLAWPSSRGRHCRHRGPSLAWPSLPSSRGRHCRHCVAVIAVIAWPSSRGRHRGAVIGALAISHPPPSASWHVDTLGAFYLNLLLSFFVFSKGKDKTLSKICFILPFQRSWLQAVLHMVVPIGLLLALAFPFTGFQRKGPCKPSGSKQLAGKTFSQQVHHLFAQLTLLQVTFANLRSEANESTGN
jgi:hypothetical protein